MLHREDNRVALVRGEHLNARLSARPLFGKDKFSALEIDLAPAQKDGDLKRKDPLAV
jgi:hypothetical protein